MFVEGKTEEKKMMQEKERTLLGFVPDQVRRQGWDAAQMDELAFAKCPKSFGFKKRFVLRCFLVGVFLLSGYKFVRNGHIFS